MPSILYRNNICLGSKKINCNDAITKRKKSLLKNKFLLGFPFTSVRLRIIAKPIPNKIENKGKKDPSIKIFISQIIKLLDISLGSAT
jgi:hypothetical protein